MKCAYRYCSNNIEPKKKFCSLHCFYKENGILNRKEKVEINCSNPSCKRLFKVLFKNQIYCNKSCAASVNNARRLSIKLCEICQCELTDKRKYCSNCKNTKTDIRWVNESLEQLRLKYKLSEYHAKLRFHSRSVYLKSDKDYKCVLCSYNKHVDICHVKPIAQFDSKTIVSKINHIDNLIALCKNHHWEFDNNKLDKENLIKINSIIQNL